MKTILRDLDLKIACAGFVLTLSMVSANVMLRYVAGKSLLFSEEISYLGFAYTVFLGAAYLYRRRVMIAVDFLVNALSPARQRRITQLTLFVMLLANLGLVWISLLLVSEGWIRRTAYLELPYAWIHGAAAIGFVLMAIYSAVMLARSLSGREVTFAEAAEQI